MPRPTAGGSSREHFVSDGAADQDRDGANGCLVIVKSQTWVTFGKKRLPVDISRVSRVSIVSIVSIVSTIRKSLTPEGIPSTCRRERKLFLSSTAALAAALY